MSKVFIIPAEGHQSQGLRLSLIVGCTRLRFRAKFYPNCVYKPQREPEQISKLYGISWGHHHECSARVGWRSDGSRIEVLSYVYVAHGRHESQHLDWIDVQEWHEYLIERTGDEVAVSINGEEPVRHTLFAPAAASYKLYPYFGGEVPAPHEMWIEVEVLEVNGLGG